MTPTTPVQDLATQWSFARKLYPIYFELAREFAIDVKPCAELEAGVEMPGKDTVEQANQWLKHMDQAIQVHQLRQFLQTSSLVSQEGLVTLLQHFLAKANKSDAIRDKVDFLLVQYFSQIAPAGLNDAEVDLAYVAQAMETVLGQVELKPPVWLNALDRVDPAPSVLGPITPVAPPSSAIAGDPDLLRAGRSVVRVLSTACGLGIEGSGWAVAPGLIVTNAHVVAGAEDTTVTTQDVRLATSGRPIASTISPRGASTRMSRTVLLCAAAW